MLIFQILVANFAKKKINVSTNLARFYFFSAFLIGFVFTSTVYRLLLLQVVKKYKEVPYKGRFQEKTKSNQIKHK